MYCQKCGTQIPDDSVFCTTCGERVRGTPDVPPEDEGPDYAGFLPRLGALIIDTVIVWITVFLISAVYYAIYYMSNPVRAYDSAYYTEDFIIIAVAVLIQYLYFAGFHSSSRQATIGKSVLGLVVTDTDGRRLTFWRASLRYIGRIIVSITLGLGYLLIIFTEKKQGLHDFIADTVVIRKRS